MLALETAFQDEPSAFKGETDLFIYPGYKFKVVDHMITNFPAKRHDVTVF